MGRIPTPLAEGGPAARACENYRSVSPEYSFGNPQVGGHRRSNQGPTVAEGYGHHRTNKRSDTVGELRNVRDHPPRWVSSIRTGRVNSSELRDLGAL